MRRLFKALQYLACGWQCMERNLGTGRSYSVLEMVRSFEKASGRKVPFKIAPRRPGDLDAMCADAWRWQKSNPMGYKEKREWQKE